MKVRWNVPNPTTLTTTKGGPKVHLKYGLNEVDDEVFEALMECESNRDHVRAGHLTNPEEDGLDEEPEGPEVEEEPEVDSDEPAGAVDDEHEDESDGAPEGGETEADDEPGPYDHLENLDDYTNEGAAEVIGDTFTPEVLNRWAQADERKGVASAIADQLALIDGAGG